MSDVRRDIHSVVRERIVLDPGFYDALVEDPRAALRAVIGIEIPASVVLRVHRQTPSCLHIVLPFARPAESGEDSRELSFSSALGLESPDPLSERDSSLGEPGSRRSPIPPIIINSVADEHRTQQAPKPTLQVLIRDRLDTDPRFLTNLKRDPHRAIAETLGLAVPDWVEIILHEQTSTEINLVLPYRAPLRADQELSDDQLALVSGGLVWTFDDDGTIADGRFVL